MYRRILVAVDGSPVSNAGLDKAVELARLTGGSLRLVHVIDDLSFAMAGGATTGWPPDMIDTLRESGQALLDESKRRVEQQGGTAECALVEVMGTRMADEIARQARDWRADLIVIGTHGRRGVGRVLLGSDAEQVARTAPVPVLLVRANAAP